MKAKKNLYSKKSICNIYNTVLSCEVETKKAKKVTCCCSFIHQATFFVSTSYLNKQNFLLLQLHNYNTLLPN